MIGEPLLMEVWRCGRCKAEWVSPFERDILERSHLCNPEDVGRMDCQVPLMVGTARSVNVYCVPEQVE